MSQAMNLHRNKISKIIEEVEKKTRRLQCVLVKIKISNGKGNVFNMMLKCRVFFLITFHSSISKKEKKTASSTGMYMWMRSFRKCTE